MKNSPLSIYFEGVRKSIMALGEATCQSHRVVAGSAREILIRGFLRDHLPRSLAVGTGQVFGHRWAHGLAEDISTQQDVVIYRPDLPVLMMDGAQLFFRESVVATIEVRTNHVSADVAKLFEDTSSVARIEPVSTFTLQMSAEGTNPRSRTRRVLCGVLYFRKLKTRRALVEQLNRILAAEVAKHGCLAEVPGPDFFYSPEAGLVFRKGQFDTLLNEIPGLDAVHDGLTDAEKEVGTYRRGFGNEESWRGLQTIVLELAERCQRYAVSYSNLSAYV